MPKPRKDRGEKRFQNPMDFESFSQNLIGQKTRPPPYGRGDENGKVELKVRVHEGIVR